jgi:serine/threonine-protein kinase
MSGDAKQEYFSDGISEELLNALSRVSELQVVARTSSFSFKGQNVDVSTIAHKLNVGAVLEGSVRRAGNTVRITVQLVNALSGFHMWAQSYDRNLTDILKVQSDVATSVAEQLKVKLVADEADKVELGGTRNPEAYDSYLRGVSSRRVGLEDERAELAAYDRAIALDPKYAAAMVSRATVLVAIEFDTTNFLTRNQLRQQALVAAKRAVALAPDYGEAHMAVGEILANSLDFVGAAPELEQALELAPGNARVQRVFAWFAGAIGHRAQALAAARRAVTLDPQNYASHERLAMVLYLARQFSDAQEAFLHAQALNPGSRHVADEMVWVLVVSGQLTQAQERCESSATPLDDDARHFCLALVYHAQSRQGAAEFELKQMQAIDGDSGAYANAIVYSHWGDRAALSWLNKAEQLRDPLLGALKGEEWIFDPIREDPQFKALEARLNFPP